MQQNVTLIFVEERLDVDEVNDENAVKLDVSEVGIEVVVEVDDKTVCDDVDASELYL